MTTRYPDRRLEFDLGGGFSVLPLKSYNKTFGIMWKHEECSIPVLWDSSPFTIKNVVLSEHPSKWDNNETVSCAFCATKTQLPKDILVDIVN